MRIGVRALVRGLGECAPHINGLIRRERSRVKQSRRALIGSGRRSEAGPSFTSFQSVYDTVAINRRRAEKRLFIRSVSQSEAKKKKSPQ